MSRSAYRARVLAALPGTRMAIQEKTGLGTTTVWRWINDIQRAMECHITGWQRHANGSPFQPVYAAGQGVDVPCRLKPLACAQISRRYRTKARKSGDWEDNLAQMRTAYWAKRAMAKGDPLVNALFGRAA